MPNEAAVKRNLVGLLALVGVLGGAAMLSFSSMESQLGAALLRSGILLGALWLAMPSRRWGAAWENISPWTILAFAALCLVAGRYKYAFLGGIALMVLCSIFLRPRRRRP